MQREDAMNDGYRNIPNRNTWFDQLSILGSLLMRKPSRICLELISWSNGFLVGYVSTSESILIHLVQFMKAMLVRPKTSSRRM